jgi:hypothetical protein
VLRDLVHHATAIAERRPVLVRVRKNSDFIEFSVIVSGAGRMQPALEAAFYNHHPAGDFSDHRLETVSENLKLLGGHLHLITLPAEGFEIGICLPAAPGSSAAGIDKSS